MVAERSEFLSEKVDKNSTCTRIPSIKTAFFMDGALWKCFPSMNTGLFMDGTLRIGLWAVKMRVFYGREGG